ncbi:collagen alpha-1(I) chain-like [Manis pentadactyla]|uniref:collagen alpha-1(I) chain-like n=1 Tax=Manis pentadactyla TaxID=143292 RepID=UPI001874C53B|nr:collagen alpha-1(I) chain-like [Manis pentadactyla]
MGQGPGLRAWDWICGEGDRGPDTRIPHLVSFRRPGYFRVVCERLSLTEKTEDHTAGTGGQTRVSGPPEEACTFGDACEMGPPARTSRAAGRNGRCPILLLSLAPGLCTAHAAAWPHHPGAHGADAEVPFAPRLPPPPHPHPHYGRRAALGPGSRAAPPPPRAGAPPAFRRGCGSRKPRASRSELQQPVAPQTTPPAQPDDAAGPSGGRAAPGPNLGPSTRTGRTGRTVWIGAREAMGTRAGPAVAGQREPRV